ncbi:ABC transporter [Paenibacillus sp. IB182496]|uniref:ABC transporter n=1 Tax=Paenibacillus sabuli TaxID=2772509 RepID=A0A927GTG1_9BACL|nr:ABC transporter [Paenibacillus sabuli]MBD2846692.1 ABC transporter [Paenibacillus sabuli]
MTIRPFTRELDACYEFQGHREAYARMLLAVENRLLGVLTGEVGSGKSALLRRLFRSLDPMRNEMSEAMLLELRFVMSHQMDARSLFPVLLAGQPELRKRLRLKKYEAISQRIGIQYHLGGMSREETAAYIRHHLEVAKLQRPVFSESAIQMLYAASQGLPRVVNQICSQILFEAEGNETEVVEEMQISRVLTDMERQRGTAG